MKVITFMIEKGGCGKSTLALNLAAGLALKQNADGEHNRVLFIDTDPQDGCSTLSMGLARGRGTYNLIAAPDSPEGDWRNVLSHVPDNFVGGENVPLFVTRSNLEVSNIPLIVSDDTILQQRLEQVESLFDYVIIDTSPAPGMLIKIIAAATTDFIVPTQCESPSAIDALPGTLSRIVKAIERYGDEDNPPSLLGIVPNQKRNTVLHRDVYAALREQYGNTVMRAIPYRTAFSEAIAHKQSIFAYSPDTIESDIMWQFVEAMQQRMETKYGEKL